MRILIKKTSEGWKVRFPFGNPWKAISGEWLPVNIEADAHIITAHMMKDYPGCNVFTIVPIGEDLEQTD
jgi:hypothetical protein